MLTKSDLQAIGKVIDLKLKEIAADVSAIQARVADMETAQVRKLDIFRLYNLISAVEKRMAAVEGKMLKFATKDDLQNFATKDDLKKSLHKLENRLQKSINRLTDLVDNRLSDAEERVDKLDQHIDHPPIAAS